MLSAFGNEYKVTV